MKINYKIFVPAAISAILLFVLVVLLRAAAIRIILPLFIMAFFIYIAYVVCQSISK